MGLLPEQEFLEHTGSVREELFNEVRSLRVIARLAGERQVADPMGSTPRAAEDVFHFERNVGRPAVGAGPPPFFEQVLAHLITREFALLVLHPFDLRVLHEVHIKLHHLHADCFEGAGTQQAARPGERVGDAAFQGRREPALPSRSILEAGCAVARFASASRLADSPAIIECLFDGISPVLEFGSPDHFASRVIDESQPCCFATWVDLEPQFLHLRRWNRLF